MGIRVLMIGPYPMETGLVNGGVEAVTSVLVPALAARDDIDRVTVLRFDSSRHSDCYRREGSKVDVYSLPCQRRLNELTRSYDNFRRARTLIDELKPDIVHGHGITTTIGDIAVRCSAASVVTVHGLPASEMATDMRASGERNLRDNLRMRLIHKTEQRVLRRAKVVISISRYAGEEFSDLIRGRHVSIHNPAAAEFFALAPPIATEPRLLFAGVLRPVKNLTGIIEAFGGVVASMPGARLTIVGPQPCPDYTRTIRTLVASLGLSGRVEILDPLDNEGLSREIVAARAVVMFSWQENSPTIIAQAMAAGKPIVASGVGGIPEMVDDGETGFLVEPGNVSQLSDRLCRVLEDLELSLRMGREGHEAALLRYQPDEVARLTVDAYQLALS